MIGRDSNLLPSRQRDPNSYDNNRPCQNLNIDATLDTNGFVDMIKKKRWKKWEGKEDLPC